MKISLVTAVLNNQAMIGDCIGSIQGQTHRELEHIIIDGGSTDGTLEVISRATENVPLCTRVISEPDHGIYDALNKGILMATGEIVGFLHADDLYAHDRVLETVAAHMKRHGTDSCYGDLVYVDRQDTGRIFRYWKSGPFRSDLIAQGWMPPHPTFFVRREVYEKFGMFDTSFSIAADYELMVRFLAKHGISTCYIQEILVRMRVGGASNRSLSNIMRKSLDDYRTIKRHGLGGVPTLVRKNVSKLSQFFGPPKAQ